MQALETDERGLSENGVEVRRLKGREGRDGWMDGLGWADVGLEPRSRVAVRWDMHLSNMIMYCTVTVRGYQPSG